MTLFSARASHIPDNNSMPVAVGGDETGSRRSSEDNHPMDSDYSSPNATLYNSPNLYDFPKLEGKDPHEQARFVNRIVEC